MSAVPGSTSPLDYQLITALLGTNDAPAAIEHHVKSLQPSTIRRILNIFDAPSQSIPALQVLRALWYCPALQPTILAVLSSPSFRGHSYQERLIEEVEVLLAADARDASKSAKLRTQIISTCATTVCKQMHYGSSSYASSLLLFCAHAAGQIRTKRGRSLQIRILKYLLPKLEHSANLHLGPFVTILNSDIHMDVSDELRLLRALDSFVALQCEDRQLPAIFHAVVTALGRTKTRRQRSILGLISLNVLRKTSPQTLSNVLDILKTLIIDSELVAQRLVDSISELMPPRIADGRLHCERTKIGPSHISLVYFLLGSTTSQRIQEGLNNIIERIISDEELPFDTSHVASSSAGVTEPPFVRAFTLLNSTQIPAVCANAETIATVFEGQVWSQQTASQSWGVRMLFEIFVLMPRSRGKVMKAIFTALTNRETPDAVTLAFCGLLEKLCDARKAALYLREFRPDLQNLLNFADCIPPQVDCRVVSALVRLSMTSLYLSDQMILFMRKAAGSRLLKLQRIAGAGLLAVIEHSAISEETRIEACTTFGDILELSETPLRSHLILDLIAFVGRNENHSSHIQTVSEMTVRRLIHGAENCSARRLKSADVVGGEKSAAGYDSDPSKLCGELRSDFLVGDDVPVLLRLCDKLKTHNRRIDEILDKLRGYLGDIKRVLYDVYAVCEGQLPASNRIAQICSIYQTMICIDADRVPASHVSAYAICLFVREYELSKTRCGNSSSDILPIAQKSDGFAVLASVSAQEAASMELNQTHNRYSEGAISLAEYVRALHVIAKSEEPALWRRIVQREVLGIVLTKLRSSGQAVIRFCGLEEFRLLLSFIKDCFIATCPWMGTEYYQQCGNECCAMTTGKMDLSEGNPLPSERRTGSISSPWQCTECVEMASKVLSSLAFPGTDQEVKPATPQVAKLSRTLPSSTRQFCVAILMELLSNGRVDLEWSVLHTFTREVLEPGTVLANPGGLSASQEKETPTAAQCDDLKTDSLGRLAIPEEGIDHTEAILALSRVFRLEFEHSLSTALTMSYIDIFFYLLSAMEEKREDGRRAKAMIVTMITGLFRDYSICHSRVLKRMVTLLLKSFEVKRGLEFATSLIRSLGGEISLECSDTVARTGEINGRIGVEDFDADILEEAMFADSQRDNTEYPNIPRSRNEISNNTSLPGRHFYSEQGSTHQYSMEDPMMAETDAIRTLCLSETEESAVLTILCVLEYFGHIVRNILDCLRRSTKHWHPLTETHLIALDGVVEALGELFRTPFVRFPATQAPRMLLPVWKRLGDVMQDLIELVEVQLRMFTMEIRKCPEVEESRSELLLLLKHILTLLFKEDSTRFVSSSPQFVEQRSRMIFLQEKLDATATAFVLRTENKSSSHLDDLRALLQARIREIGSRNTMRNGKDETNDGVQVRANFHSRPKKKSHVRSRNRYVDGWLAEEKGDDNFVDLEDFIVPLDEDPG